MKPYYEHSGVTIYHGDCLDVLPVLPLPSAFAVVTDQPFGTGWVRGGGDVGEFKAMSERLTWDCFDMRWANDGHVIRSEMVATFTANSRLEATVLALEMRSARQHRASVVWWRKTNPRPLGPDREPIVLYGPSLPPGIAFSAYNGDTPYHPCQKPVDLMQWVIQFSRPGLPVWDPFCGTGSTLIAAKALGRDAIGIEAEERYCEIAARRLEQEVLDLGGVA